MLNPVPTPVRRSGILSAFLLTLLTLVSCSSKTVRMPADALSLRSPDTQLELKFAVLDGVPTYTLSRAGQAVVLPSRLGFDLIGRESLDNGFTLNGSAFDTFDETWEPVWGEEAQIRNHYNELLVRLKKESGEAMDIRFRLYDDGLGFRYEFPIDNKLTYFKIAEEKTEFALAGDHTAWWISGDYDTQEYNYTRSRLSEIPRINAAPRPYNASQTDISSRAVQTALQMKTDEGLYVNIHEARVLDYPTANLVLMDDNRSFQIHLTPDAEGVKGRLQAPCVSPWRTVQVCTSAPAVLASRLILNLNDLDMTLGHEIELSASYDISKDAKLSAGFSFMTGTETMERLKRASDDTNLRWTWLTLTVSPRIFQTRW